jgi:charged multivesicular body protein 3
MKAQINSVSMQLQQNLGRFFLFFLTPEATYKVAGAMKKSTEIMHMMNNIVKVPELQMIMMTMAQEMEKVGFILSILFLNARLG